MKKRNEYQITADFSGNVISTTVHADLYEQQNGLYVFRNKGDNVPVDAFPIINVTAFQNVTSAQNLIVIH